MDDGDLNAGFYEPTTKRVHMVVGSRPKTTTWITLDAATGKYSAARSSPARRWMIPP